MQHFPMIRPQISFLWVLIFAQSVFTIQAAPAAAPVATLPPKTNTEKLLQKKDFQYLGAFRLPGGGTRPKTFEYGGAAMTFNPQGDASGPKDGFPGSLFITGHDRLAYGELPDGNQVAEVEIPKPVKSKNLGDLPVAKFRQGFQDVTKGFFKDLDEIPRIAMQYLNAPATGPKIHLAWGQHMQPDPPAASHAWFNPDLSAPQTTGTWFIGAQSLYSVNGYLLEIPGAWAAQYTAGRCLGTGRYKDGGWSGMGPALFAYCSWNDSGAPAPPGSRLSEKVLLLYQSSLNSDKIEYCLKGYQHPDEWEGAAWIETKTGKTAVLFAGTKSTGLKYWYGYVNPQGPAYPCVDGAFVGQFPVCRSTDGRPCPAADLKECAEHNSYRGWWSTRFDAQFILYNPADLARVADGALASWEPQPYAFLDIDEYLLLNPAGIEPEMLGMGDQRRYRIGEITFDRSNGLLYVLELFADQARPVVHVWKVR